MPICPSCKSEIKARKNGACPVCSEPLQIYNGMLYRESVGSVPSAVLAAFEKHVSIRTSHRQGYPVQFHFSKKTAQYKLELTMAERLLAQCDGSLELALKTLDVLFDNPQFSFKTRSSLAQCVKDTPLAISIAQAALENEHRLENARNAYLDVAMSRPSIFS